MSTHETSLPGDAGARPDEQPAEAPPESPTNAHPEHAEFHELQPFREVFLSYFDRVDREPLRRAGDVLSYPILEAWHPDFTESATAHLLRAVADDLDYLEKYLRLEIAPSRHASSLPPLEEKLCARAEKWAARVLAVVQEIREAIGPEPPWKNEQV